METLYNSNSFIVVKFDVQVAEPMPGPLLLANPGLQLNRGGYEIVDKLSCTEIFIEGALAQQFQEGVDALGEGQPSEEDYDDFIERYANLGQTSVAMH